MRLFNLLIAGILFTGILTKANAKEINPQDDRYKNTHSFSLNKSLQEGVDYLPKIILFKIRPEFRSKASRSIGISSLNSLFDYLGSQEIGKMFPGHTPSSERAIKEGSTDLSLIYIIKYTADISLEKAINTLLKNEAVLYAEPYYLPKLFYDPNDPEIAKQAHLNTIKAFEAWNITTGDENVVIGIIDNGIDWDHADLIDNIAYNTADTIDGVDNDNDGYIDNYRGWDVADNDNEPTGGSHGTHVSGCASPSTDNGKGIAGPGFKAKILPVKIADSNGDLVAGYQGIVYAADHGAHIINCSWGGSGYSNALQDIIDYATIDKGALVVAAAGNDNKEDSYYPAAYEGVLSVAATQTSGTYVDNKAGFSNYGYWVDISAPGTSVYSTYDGDTYTSIGGTSMASPIVAGCAALVKAQFPSYTNMQIAARLKATADNIESKLAGALKGKMGTGRVNLYRAVSENTPGIEIENIAISDKNDEVFVADDVLNITADFTNYLDASSGLTATLSVTSGAPYISLADKSFNIGNLATLEKKDNQSAPFTAVINTNAPQNTKITFKITVTNGTYTIARFFDVIVNVDYININVNQVKTSVTSKGWLGFNDEGRTQGLGMTYNDVDMLFDGGLMVGISSTQVSDGVRGPNQTNDDDFSAVVNVKQISPSSKADFESYGQYNDSKAGTDKLDLVINHRAYAWSQPPYDKFVIHQYTIINDGANALSDVYAGIFTDFDINDAFSNVGRWDNDRKMSYAYPSDSPLVYGGVKILTDNAPPGVYNINNGGENGSINIYDGYTNALKYTTISGGLQRENADSGDVSLVVSTGPFNINAGDSIIVAFALVAGDDLTDLQKNADKAQEKYNGLDNPSSSSQSPDPFISDFHILNLYPNPAFSEATILLNNFTDNTVIVEVFDQLGKKVQSGDFQFPSKGFQKIRIDLEKLESGIYYIQVRSGSQLQKKKLLITK